MIMDFYRVVENRHSVRGYTDRAIPTDALKRIGDAVSLAPTACNLQPFEVLVVLNDELRARIAQVYTRDWLKNAPAIAVAIGDVDAAWKRVEGDSIIDVDMGIVMEHFVLAAQAEGLGTCWICAYDRSKMDAVMGLSGSKTVVAVTPLGYPANVKSASDRPERKPITDIFKIVE